MIPYEDEGPCGEIRKGLEVQRWPSLFNIITRSSEKGGRSIRVRMDTDRSRHQSAVESPAGNR